MFENFEVNGNLEDEKDFNLFLENVAKTMIIFTSCFGKNVMSKIDLYVDNGIKSTGYTPITTVILKKYIIIKLGIEDFSNVEQIVYQFAHELCHYVFFSLKGLNRTKAEIQEENICSAMSLILIKRLYPNSINKWITHVENLSDEK